MSVEILLENVLNSFSISTSNNYINTYYTMESGLTMVLHSVIIGVVLYFIMTLGLKQQANVAENRSILIASVVLIYMIVFGHGLPTKINKFI